jgi:glycosyltransferase involved in cell wall biosynthesis
MDSKTNTVLVKEKKALEFVSERCLSVIVPIYNEEGTIDTVLSRILAQPSVEQIIAVDDGSTDRSRELLRRWQLQEKRTQVVFHDRNFGKGAAIRSALALVAAPIVIIQDGDLEYDPADYQKMLDEIWNNDVDVVYGSRFLSRQRNQNPRWHTIGNRILTAFGNLATGFKLTDSATCYKMFRREIIQGLALEEDGFGFCPEVTAKIAKLNLRVTEVPVSYYGRTAAEGKKIRLHHGFDALRCIVKYNWMR